MRRSLPLCVVLLASSLSVASPIPLPQGEGGRQPSGWRPGEGLIAAVKAGDVSRLRSLLKSPSAVNFAETDGTTALHWAVRNSATETVSLLLAAGANVNAANRYGVTALSLAAENGNPAITALLLKAGANPNEALPEGETVLMTAARGGHVEVVRLLLAAGADHEARESFHGETALIWAASENHAEVVRALVDAGADVNGRSRLETIARRTHGLSILPLGNWTPLMYAARQGALEAAAALVAAGAGVNLTDPDATTALVLAIINSQYHVAAMLLDRGADPNIADTSGMTALYAAVDMHTLPWMFGRPDPIPRSDAVSDLDVIKMILDRGGNPNAPLSAALIQRLHTNGDESLGAGSTPFMRAAKSGDIEVMRLLLAHGANPKAVGKDGATALMLAAGLGYRDGNAAIPTRDRGTEAEAIAAIELCLQVGIDINAANTRGDTALHAAVAGRGSDAIVRFLASKGAKLDAKNAQGRTPLEVATTSRRDRSSNAAILRELMGVITSQP